MGIDIEVAAFLSQAHKDGVTFQRTLTVGRQFLLAHQRTLHLLASEQPSQPMVKHETERFAETFFQTFLHAEHVASIDATDYEGATIIHDMNTPIPKHYTCSFDAVIDGGSLEHIFNFPVAMANCMQATKVGGSLFNVTVANNFLGHGFYQFSPELFFRTLAPIYGFQIKRLVIVEYSGPNLELARAGTWYDVTDPQQIRSRVTLVNDRPILMMVHAQKIAHLSTLFDPSPQQSDYAIAWERSRGSQYHHTEENLRRRIAGLPLLGPLLVAFYNQYKLRAVHALRNRTFFTPAPRRSAPSSSIQP